MSTSLRTINFCECCPYGRAFRGEHEPVSLEIREPSMARNFYAKFGKTTTPVDVLDQFGEKQTSIEVPNAAFEGQGNTIMTAVKQCQEPFSRSKCGAVALLHQKYSQAK